MSYQTIAYVYISHIQSNISIIFIFVSINRKIVFNYKILIIAV